MILQNLARKKGKGVAGHSVQSWAKRRRHLDAFPEDGTRGFATGRPSASQLREELAKEHVKNLSNKQKAKKEARAVDKDFFMSVLNSSATKRDAKAYIQRFTPSKESPKPPPTNPVAPEQRTHPSQGNGVNLGGLYGPASVVGSPQFLQYPHKQTGSLAGPRLHVALVKIRAPQTLDDETLNGVGRTLSQLARLGLLSVVVVDCNRVPESTPDPSWRSVATTQANRIVAAIDSEGVTEARLVENIIGVYEGSEEPRYGAHIPIATHVTLRELMMTPLRRGVIPVIPSLAYTDITQTAVPILASDAVLALTRELAGLPTQTCPDEDPEEVRERLQTRRAEVSLDRIIILDPLGGIPTPHRPNGYHVFLNMEQEFEPAKKDLLKGVQLDTAETSLQGQSKRNHVSDLGSSNPFSRFVETEFGSPKPPPQTLASEPEATITPKPENKYHLQNLELVRSVLSMLPPSSSALLTTPDEAANAGKETPFRAGGVGTRRHRNPLIHNLLTDKPVFSSSLPMGRLGQTKSMMGDDPSTLAASITPTTFAKHGMHITIFPNPNLAPWEPPRPGKEHMKLTDSYIDLPRLVHLINDSFGRTLDVKEYLKRVNGRIAGVIIAGEYEGGALLTWETPPGVPDDESPESRARMVPYLDKFAVLKKSQGSGGVADAVFTAMVRDCFPNGVVWRSRSTNVVNKWYFERSRGTWKLTNTGWTMFWTTPDMDRQTFLDYEAVCRGIEPSWADGKSRLD
ncbi:Amino-acid acetyltransferase, mitochondrial [Lachnellula willkommii]|uniref:Amino-acid acetyltransferase, mitochondrial n=1 Tax=Lachnellula willkommii TaxID=215461 RepID=A0A559M6J6_9HELO|nr:Amino-acid acetyltransferase, mitochondrial [Lachnellula willkommii]